MIHYANKFGTVANFLALSAIIIGLCQATRPHQINNATTDVAHRPVTKEQLNYYKSLECSRDLAKLQDDAFTGKHNMVGLSYAVVQSHMRMAEYNHMLMHNYDTAREMQLASGPQVDQKQCLSELEHLNERIASANSIFHGDDIELYRLLGTYGRMGAGLLNGNIFWAGTYGECLRLKTTNGLGKDGRQVSSHRYCVAKLSHKLWQSFNDDGKIALALGVCLPEACDSTDVRNKYQLIENLIQFNDRNIDFNDTFRLSGLYCLPDEQSEMRSIRHSSRASITLTFVIGWLAMVAAATVKHYMTTCNKTGDKDPMYQVCRSLSIIHSLRRLFATSVEEPSRTESADDSNDSNEDTKIVDLRCIEGIKVLAMWYVLCGHVLLCSTIGITYAQRAHTDIAFYMSKLVPAFAVNAFFGITGILTSYLVFKQNHKSKLITNPAKWAAFIVYRYMRIMPMYLLVVWYSKSLAKYTNAGPLWDYGTSGASHRRNCEQESWLWTLLFAANFKKPLEHCIPGGWYLANDFQFLLVTPLFLYLLHRSPSVGKKALLSCMAISYVANLRSIIFAELDDLRSIANFEPHGFKTYVTYLSHNYTRPYYRIPAYLSGLYMGFLLYTMESNKLRHRAERREKSQRTINTGDSTAEQSPEPDWPDVFKRYCRPVAAVLLFLHCITPYVASGLHFSKQSARISVALVIANYNLLFAVVIGCYILYTATTTTRHTLARILSAPFWKPLSRLGLCAMLINVEVMCYMFQGREYLFAWTTHYLMSVKVYSIVVIYIWSAFVSVVFESPMAACLNHLLTYLSGKLVARRAVQSKAA